MKKHQSGFTLVEIAIVLVIIGLLLGGVLKGQELINNAKVRNVADQQNAVRAAFFAFQDRYQALPGDMTAAQATAMIPGALGGGNGNGVIAATESSTAFHHLAAAGFISCSVCTVTGAASTPTNSLTNTYGGAMQIVNDAVYTDTVGAVARNNIKSGPQIPASIIGEVDQKIDDNNPNTGNFRFSAWAGGGAAPTVGTCTTTAGGATVWARAGNVSNCGGANLL
jgi:prepilin-type N-terminal cleavage/methylation domain-containing protein